MHKGAEARKLQNSYGTIAQLDAVKAIGPDLPLKVLNYYARQVIHLDQAITAGALDAAGNVNLPGPVQVRKPVQCMGQVEVIAIADSGFDLGSPINVHPAFHVMEDYPGDAVGHMYIDDASAQVQSLSRVLVRNAVSDYPYINAPDCMDHNGHGTHVAASALGACLFEDAGGVRSIRGSAPRAWLQSTLVISIPDISIYSL